MTALSTTEARAVATQAIDAVESRAGLEVLAVDMPDGTYILDNQNRDVKLKYLSGEAHYQPIFALARRKQWLYGRPTT